MRHSVNAFPGSAGGMMTRDGHLALAMTAAQCAGEVLRRFFRELGPDQVEEKARNDFVSAADRASEDVIFSFLSTLAPEIGFLGEEGSRSGGAGSRWVVDPLDGTANFVRGFPHFAVSLGLVEAGAIVLGVVYDPMRDELYSARAGGGAFCNGQRLRVSGRDGLDGAFIATGFPFRVHRHIDSYLRVFRDVFIRAAGIRRPGAAALDLVHTAAGVFDGFFEFSLSPWDVAAGAAIIREAGGVVTNLDGEEDVMSHGNVVAGSPRVHADVLELVRNHVSEADVNA